MFATGLWKLQARMHVRIPSCVSNAQACAHTRHLCELWASMHSAHTNRAVLARLLSAYAELSPPPLPCQSANPERLGNSATEDYLFILKL